MAKVTINDIAKEAGVSKTAVSFAFNDPSQLAQATVQHIHAVAEKLGYSPDPIARSMTTRRTNALGLLVPQDIATVMSNPFFAQLMRGIGHICNSTGKTLMIVPPLWGSRLKAIPHATVDGFIVVGIEVDRSEIVLLRRRRIPFVIVDSAAPDDIPSVNVDDRSGARAAMRHVLEQGHRSIGVISIESGKPGPENYTGTLGARLQGYFEALSEFGIAHDDERVHFIEAPSSWQGGSDAFEQLWALPQRPSAIVTMSDILAFGVLDTARSMGLSLPEELSVVGFDDLPDARLMRPPLTTVRQPVEEKGRLAAEILVNAIENQGEPQHHILPTELVIRDSVLPISRDVLALSNVPLI